MAFTTVDDINAYLPDGSVINSPVVEADAVNVAKIQLSVERVVRGYLARILSTATMASWDEPDNTPDIIREVAAMLEAAQLYFDQVAASSLDLDDTHISQILYNRAMALLNDIVSGQVVIPDVPSDTPETMTLLDFFPVDDTDRAFTLSQQF
jgi:hypothetical protein